MKMNATLHETRFAEALSGPQATWGASQRLDSNRPLPFLELLQGSIPAIQLAIFPRCFSLGLQRQRTAGLLETLKIKEESHVALS